MGELASRWTTVRTTQLTTARRLGHAHHWRAFAVVGRGLPRRRRRRAAPAREVRPGDRDWAPARRARHRCRRGIAVVAYGGGSEAVVAKATEGVYDYACQAGSTVTGPVAVPVWEHAPIRSAGGWSSGTTTATRRRPCVSRGTTTARMWARTGTGGPTGEGRPVGSASSCVRCSATTSRDVICRRHV